MSEKLWNHVTKPGQNEKMNMSTEKVGATSQWFLLWKFLGKIENSPEFSSFN